MPQAAAVPFPTPFAALGGPRQAAKGLHPWPEPLVPVLCVRRQVRTALVERALRGEVARSHGGTGNRLHWTPGGVARGDPGAGHGPVNRAVVQHIAPNPAQAGQNRPQA